MFKFHYDVMLPKYNDKLHMVMTDTDSFIYEIETYDLFEDFNNKDMKARLDLSGLPEHHKLYDNSNKKVLEKMSIENEGKIISEVVSIRPKVYALKFDGGKESKKCKGVNTGAVKNKLTFQDYVDTVTINKVTYVKSNKIQSKVHSISSVHINKKALSNIDNKRYVLMDGVSTLAHGHYKISTLR